MIGFSGIILFIVSFYATIFFFRLYNESRRIFHFCLSIASIFVAIIGISDYLAVFFPILDPGFIDDWSTVFAVSFALSASAALIRDFKPAMTRFPKIFTFFPLLLILVYPFIIETILLKTWIIAIYQGSTLIIGMLIYGYRTSQDNRFGYMFVGLSFFLITFILFHLPAAWFVLPDYGWMLLVSSGILIITVGYHQIYLLENTSPTERRESDSWFV